MHKRLKRTVEQLALELSDQEVNILDLKNHVEMLEAKMAKLMEAQAPKQKAESAAKKDEPVAKPKAKRGRPAAKK